MNAISSDFDGKIDRGTLYNKISYIMILYNCEDIKKMEHLVAF